MTTSEKHGVTWIGEDVADDGTGLRIGREGDELVAEFLGVGVLRASRAGGARFDADARTNQETVQKLWSGVIPALLRHLEGELTLHGSAVAFGDAALACIGASGAGKSTAAAHMCKMHGVSLVADDTVALDLTADRIAVLPTERVSWLVGGKAEPSEGEAKAPLLPPRVATAKRPLVAAVRLLFDAGAPDRPRLRRLRGHDALSALLPTVIRFVLDDPAAQVREAEQLDRLAAQVPIFELRRKKDPTTLAAASDLLARLAEGRIEEDSA